MKCMMRRTMGSVGQRLEAIAPAGTSEQSRTASPQLGRGIGTHLSGSLLSLCCLALVLLVVGCNFTPRPEKPDLSPTESAEQAIEEYDTNGDSLISEDEAEAAPGLLAAFQKIDSDGDEQLSKEEIEARIVYYKTATTWVINGSCRVTFKRRPLPDATVVFEPESFLGASFQPCSGVTNERGEAFISREGSEIKGIYLGFYRVRITKEKPRGGEMIPARYNTETTLGFEANNDVPDDANYSSHLFELK